MSDAPPFSQERLAVIQTSADTRAEKVNELVFPSADKKGVVASSLSLQLSTIFPFCLLLHRLRLQLRLQPIHFLLLLLLLLLLFLRILPSLISLL